MLWYDTDLKPIKLRLFSICFLWANLSPLTQPDPNFVCETWPKSNVYILPRSEAISPQSLPLAGGRLQRGVLRYDTCFPTMVGMPPPIALVEETNNVYRYMYITPLVTEGALRGRFRLDPLTNQGRPVVSASKPPGSMLGSCFLAALVLTAATITQPC